MTPVLTLHTISQNDTVEHNLVLVLEYSLLSSVRGIFTSNPSPRSSSDHVRYISHLYPNPRQNPGL